MTAASSLAFPGSRTLAAWARQLTRHRPRAFWVGHLFLHSVEALVTIDRSHPLDPLHRWVLQALAAEQRAPPPAVPERFLERLERRLHLGLPLLRQFLRVLATEGLIQPAPNEQWAISDRGRAALAHGAYPRAGQERRVFPFVVPGGGGPAAESAPHFLHVNGAAGIPWPEGEHAGFDLNLLHSSIHQPSVWKQQHRFPEEVREVVQAASGTLAPPWEQVIVDRPERLPAALVLSGEGGNEQLLGFAVRQEGWVLNADHPIFTVRGDWRRPFPELALTEESCRLAWLSWCQSRDWPSAEVNACSVMADGLRLRVTPPLSLAERLRSAPALKGETWLLVGEGALRASLQLDLDLE